MPPSTTNGSTASPAMLLLDRKAMKKQMAKGGQSPSSSSGIKSKSQTATPLKAPPSYNPRQLLNPKASSAKMGSNRSSRMSSPSTGSQTASDDAEGLKRPRQAVGGNMLEDLYGVECRGDRPQKLVKITKNEDESETTSSSKPPKSTFESSGNGVIGNFMKVKKDDESEDQADATVVDLTTGTDAVAASDDDEVVVTGHKEIGEEVVCYGVVKVSVNAHRVPRSSSIFDAPGHWAVVQCNLVRAPSKDMVIKVTDSNHNEFGKLEPGIASALAPIMDTKITNFKAVARIPMRPRLDTEGFPGQNCSEIYPIHITIYGPRRYAETIGKRFSQKNIWFEKPLAMEKGSTLFNPHADQRRLTGPLGASTSTNRTTFADSRTIEEAANAVSRVFDSLATSDRTLPQMEPSSIIVTPLLDHQKQGLWFMFEREKPRKFSNIEAENTSLWREKYRPNGAKVYHEIVTGLELREEPPQVLGGLLADMMGLGKTIEILSLIACTLTSAKHFAEQTVIRTTPEDAKYLRNCKTTLLVSPLSAVKNWEDQIREHVKPGALSYYVYHGPGRTKNAFELANYDIVIATYGTVAYELSRQLSSPLHKLRWFRIVLDEAHTIREQKTVQSQTIYSLWAMRRWAVTGTPIQNRLEDLGSLVKFLRLYPYSEPGKFLQHIKAPIMAGNATFLKSLRVFVDSFTLRRLKDQIDLPDRDDIIVHLEFSPEEKSVHDFFRTESQKKMQVVTQGGRGSSYHHMLTSIMTLRLVSAHGRDLLNSKDKARLRGSTKSEAIDLEQEAQHHEITSASAYNILDLMTEAAFNNCMKCKRLVPNDPASDDQETLTGIMLSCYDLICANCFTDHKPSFDEHPNQQHTCPICSGQISGHYIEVSAEGLEAARESKETAEPVTKAKRITYSGPHTKTKALLNDLAQVKETSLPLQEKGEPPIKSVVFSEFTSHLDLIGRALYDNGYQFLRIDGTMNLSQRRQILDAFNDDPTYTVLLASIKAAGQGLNLTAASRAFIMEPLWNPAAEQQAVERVHRLGQKRDVLITRYLMNESIEVKIRELQKAKQKMADISMNQNHKALSKQEQREESMKKLKELFNK